MMNQDLNAAGLSTTIIRLLREYDHRRALPVDFVARLLQLDRGYVLGDLKALEKRGVVTFEGDSVRLTG